MSDSVTKWHEMNEVKFEVGKTVTRLTDDQKKEAYKVLAYYDAEVILFAAKILNSSD